MSFVEFTKLHTRSEVLANQTLVPNARGAYAWFFRQVPPGVPASGCFQRSGLTLLYVGISPKDASSSQNLRKRIKYHFRGNAEGSTMRLTLGCLLADISGFPLRRVGSGKRMTFTHLGEQWLDAWMESNALVCFSEHPEPWLAERELLESYSLPLNIQGNRQHSFCRTLVEIRSNARMLAQSEPIAAEGNQRRRL